MSTELHRTVFQRFCDVLMVPGALDEEILDPAIVMHLPAHDPISGIDDVTREIGRLRAAFPDKKVLIQDMFGEGDMLAARVIVDSGPHSGDDYFLGVASVETKGKSFRNDEIDIVRFEDGRIAELWLQSDIVTLMRQLGLMAA